MHRFRFRWVGLLLGVLAVGGVYAFQRPFREYPGFEYDDFPLPPDWNEKTELVLARLMYPSMGRGWGRRSGRDWANGASSWTIDYPRSDRHLAMAVRRLTRIHVRSVEQPVNPDDDGDIYYWPWLYAVEVGQWNLTDAQARTLREYLTRGGFLMVDDFHGTYEWQVFAASMSRVFPDRPIVDLDSKDPIFHALYDLDDRYQVPGVQFLYSGRTYERDGIEARWRGIYDDRGRLMVAICHNMDLGDSWEWADEPQYPEKYAALGLRIAVNYIIYGMTH